MTIGSEIAEELTGDEVVYGFSSLGIGFLAVLIGASVTAGPVSYTHLTLPTINSV